MKIKKLLYFISKGGFPRDLGPGTNASRLHRNFVKIRDNFSEKYVFHLIHKKII